jgi:carboxypeptidase PM20D1
VGKLQSLVRIATVSWPDETAIDAAAFESFHAELARQFPLLHEHLERHPVGTHSLLFRWPGRSDERPVVLMAHQDVVPVDESAPWQHAPFGAEIHEGAVWGRGTLDDKAALTGICEAVETLLAEGFTPGQDVWLSFGAREEVSGPDAALAVDALRDRGVAPWFVLDEGGAIAHEAPSPRACSRSPSRPPVRSTTRRAATHR